MRTLQRCLACRKGSWQTKDALWTTIESMAHLLGRQKQVISFVGAGGKTTVLFACAKYLHKQGKKVLVTTTTHMYEIAETILGTSSEPLVAALQKKGIAIAGQATGSGKVGYIGDAAYKEACTVADVVLVESDGSRRLPLKWLGKHEPVIPDNAQAIVCIAGLTALGKLGGESCFRWDEVTVPALANHIDVAGFAAIWHEGCLKRLTDYGIPIVPLLNQADDLQLVQAAKQICRLSQLEQAIVTSFAERTD